MKNLEEKIESLPVTTDHCINSSCGKLHLEPESINKILRLFSEYVSGMEAMKEELGFNLTEPEYEGIAIRNHLRKQIKSELKKLME